VQTVQSAVLNTVLSDDPIYCKARSDCYCHAMQSAAFSVCERVSVWVTSVSCREMSRKTTRQLVPLKQTAGDLVDEDYGLLCPSRDDDQSTSFRCCAFLLALSHIILGLASMSFGVAAVCTAVSGYYIGYGMWCGCIVSARAEFSGSWSHVHCRVVNNDTSTR